jgi:hypothetical protein
MIAVLTPFLNILPDEPAGRRAAERRRADASVTDKVPSRFDAC